jgi:hypothetical protein
MQFGGGVDPIRAGVIVFLDRLVAGSRLQFIAS